MAYLALYREWRPKNFYELVGQDHIRKTLVNALKQKKVAHAYLFSGPRGTGKTTTAKILAKALNCDCLNDVEPCNNCDSCQSIDQGHALEVLEIDAASNRGIDEIRDLRDKVRLSVSENKYKIYIIDEVHMLTTEAFNALLKTLEEPPERVVFILATTEIHKIPLTILSRVQRFEFHRISVELIKERLLKVCETLDREVDPDALLVIAQKSEGGLRDALSILDQCLLIEGKLGIQEVYQVLGMVGEEFTAELVDCLLANDYARALELLNQGINQGRDPRQIIRELIEYLRGSLIYLSTNKSPYLPDHLKEKISLQSNQIGLKKLLTWISILLQGEGQLKYASNARLASELLLVQLIYESQEDQGSYKQEGIIRRLEEMEKEIRQIALGAPGTKNLKARKTPNTSKEQKINNIKINTEINNTPTRNTLLEREQNQELLMDKINSSWSQVLEQVKKYKKSTHAFLIEGKPLQYKENNLVIGFREGFSFHKDKVNQPENMDTIEKALQDVFGISIKITNIMENEWEKTTVSNETKEDPIIKKTEDLFGSDLVVIKE